jgi:hypothetical protein
VSSTDSQSLRGFCGGCAPLEPTHQVRPVARPEPGNSIYDLRAVGPTASTKNLTYSPNWAEAWNLLIPRSQTIRDTHFPIWTFRKSARIPVHRVVDIGCGTLELEGSTKVRLFGKMKPGTKEAGRHANPLVIVANRVQFPRLTHRCVTRFSRVCAPVAPHTNESDASWG